MFCFWPKIPLACWNAKVLYNRGFINSNLIPFETWQPWHGLGSCWHPGDVQSTASHVTTCSRTHPSQGFSSGNGGYDSRKFETLAQPLYRQMVLHFKFFFPQTNKELSEVALFASYTDRWCYNSKWRTRVSVVRARLMALAHRSISLPLSPSSIASACCLNQVMF